jgi:hypothetical protein
MVNEPQGLVLPEGLGAVFQRMEDKIRCTRVCNVTFHTFTSIDPQFCHFNMSKGKSKISLTPTNCTSAARLLAHVVTLLACSLLKGLDSNVGHNIDSLE